MPSPTRRSDTAIAAIAAVGCALASGCNKPAPQFSSSEAYSRASELVKLERHYEAADRQRAVDFIAGAIKPYASSVSFQRFEATERRSGKRYPLVNIVARQNPSEPKRILLGSHWDSRLWAEQDPDPARRNEPIPGANDGGSGVAVLLELARHTAGLSKVGVDYVFFDGEEMGRPGENDGYCQGSQYFANNLSSVYPDQKPQAVVVIDMVGDRDLNLYHEVSSLQSAPAIARGIWDEARALGLASFHDAPRHHIIDDHTPFQKLGIASILIIDFDYPFWHTHADTLDKVSTESLGAVGSVLLRFLVERQRTGWKAESEGGAAATGAQVADSGSISAEPAIPEPSGPKTVFEARTAFSHFLVRDFRTQRGLYFVRDSGEVVQESEIDRDAPYKMVVPYTRVMFASYLLKPKPARSLIVGLGGGSMVHFLRHYDPELYVDAVEIDPAIVEAADKWFGVKNDERTKIVTDDAFVFLKGATDRYDVIYMDAFLKPAADTDSTGVPLRMKTAAFLKNDVIARLKPGGVVVFNLNAHPKMLEDLEIIQSSFAQTYRFVVPGTANLIVVGTTAKARLERTALQRTGAQVDQRFNADFSFERLAAHLAEEPRKGK